MAEKNFSRNFGSGLLAGGFIGMILGLLFAPKSGMETRENLKAANNKYRVRANEELRASIQKLSQRMKPLLKESNDLIISVAEAADQIRQTVVEQAKQMKQLKKQHPAIEERSGKEESTERQAS